MRCVLQIMYDLIFLIKDVGLAVFCLLLIKNFFNIFFVKSTHKLFVYIPYFTMGVWQFCLTGINEFPAVCNIIMTIILVLLIALFAYKGNIWIKFIFSFLFIVIWMLTETYFGFLFQYLNINYTKWKFIGAFASNLTFLVIINYLKVFFYNGRIQKLPTIYNVFFVFIPTGSIVIINSIFSLSNKVTGDERIWLVFASLLMLMLNIIIFKLYLSLAEALQLKNENIIYEQQLGLYEMHQREREFSMLQYRDFKHNIKNFLMTILAFLESNEYDKVTEIIHDILRDNVPSLEQVSNTGNVAVDSMMNYFYSLAKQKGVKFSLDASIPMQMPFKGADLGLLLGNALDNALEAAIDSEEGTIDVSMKYDRGNLLITIVNTFNGILKYDSRGELQTLKKDTENHGLGIKVIKKTADKYRGSVIINNSANKFMIKVLLYEPVRTESI